MKVYAPAEAITAPCPSCKAPAGVWCATSSLGPMVCERRA